MKKTSTRLLITFVLILVFASLLAVAAFAATPGTGYCVNKENKQTNIKWTMEKNGVLTFEMTMKNKPQRNTHDRYQTMPPAEYYALVLERARRVRDRQF